jgi:membrane protease YdiL (CAAX protease family)
MGRRTDGTGVDGAGTTDDGWRTAEGPAPGPAPPPVPPAPVEPPEWRPGRVPWRWRETVLGILVAAVPVVLLTILSLLTPAAPPSAAKPTMGSALFGVIVALVIDSWFLFAAWLFSLRLHHLGLRGWGYRVPRTRILWAVPTALVVVFTVNAVYSQLVTTKEQAVVSDFPHTTAGLILFLLLGCAVAPVFEETLYRGFIFQGFATSFGPVWGGLISATLFSLSHQQLDIFVPLFALGLGLAWVYYTARSIWANIVLHSLFNLISIIAWALGG